MSDTIRETSPLITPDALRKINKTNQAFYETHTKKNYGKTDVYGSQYSGTVENFGSEMLLEARKLKMEKPSLEGVFETNDYKYYFDLQYSNMIETYEQQGMLEAILKSDVFLSDKEYRIKFVDCEDIYVPRSESYGQFHVDPDNPQNESKVYKNKFIHTQTAPVLMITDLLTDTTTEVDLKLEIEDFETDYYFYNEFATQKFIESYEDGVLITIPITNEHSGLPFVWICEEIYRAFPDINMEGNEPVVGKPILLVGTDGQKDSHIYPLIYGIDSLPDPGVDGEWILKAFSELDGFIPDGSGNYSAKISNIYYTFRPEEGDDVDYEITFEEEYIKITLSNKVSWNFYRDTINDPYHAEMPLEVFFGNGSSDSNVVMVPAFNVGFSDDYLYTQYEGLCGGAQSGIHVDILSDLSINAVPKKNGTIHNLGDFDGLPTYFKSFHNATIHRSHVELYTIRDRLNRYTQNTMEKQTAGLLLDSAMPQSELKDLVSSQEPAIVYQYDPDNYLYVTDRSKIISEKNVVSEITFINENTFGNSKIPSDINKKKFVYHGNRTFSLGTVEFDPELETARVYYVNNDSLSYVNNMRATDDRKPSRTLARICDIPTWYEQLMHVEYNAPTYLFDDMYVRMEVGFSEEDLETLMNNRGFKIVMTPRLDGEPGNQWLYWNESYLPSKQTLISSGYYRTKNIEDSYLSIDSSNLRILAGGNGYAVNDTFYILIGGKAYDGVVTDVSLGGWVTGVSVDIPTGAMVSVYNLTGANTSLKTVTTSSESGDGVFKMELVVDINDYNAHIPAPDTTAQPPDDLIAFAQDGYGNIFLYKLNENWVWDKVCQVEGQEFFNNTYDRLDLYSSTNDREFKKAFNKLIFGNAYRTDESIFRDPMSYIEETTSIDYEPAHGHEGDAPSTDLSQYIIESNLPNTYYVLELVSGGNTHFNLNVYKMKPFDDYHATLPRFHRNNTLAYYNPTNRFLVSDPNENSESTFSKAQPTLFVYSPKRNKRIDGTDAQSIRDTVLITSEHTTNLNDYGSNIMESSGDLKWNVYYYPEFEFSQDYYSTEQIIRSMERSELITYIRDNFGSHAEALICEDTDYRYDYEALVKYIMDRYPIDKPEYLKGDLKVKGYYGQQTVDPSTGESMLPNPPTGGVIPLTSEMFHENVTADSKDAQSRPMNIFVIEDVTFTGFDNNLRVFDDDGNDISDTSLIIWRGNKYFFKDDIWQRLLKPVIDGYRNPSDGMFYYDQQYANIITPDSDIIYHDISTGQNYRWNGVNYVLIII